MSEMILLAEDNAGRAEDVRAALASRGFPVEVAADGAVALGRAAEIHPLAIVSDVLMPNMDGFELCWEIRRASALSGTPVILTTAGWADRDSSRFARDVGANAFVDKGMVLDILDSVLAAPAVAVAGAGSSAMRRTASLASGAPAARLGEEEFRRRHGERLLHLSLREAELLKQERDALAEIYRGSLGALAAALELGGAGAAHARRVTGYVISIAEVLGIGPGDPAVTHLVRAALLCDIGNMGIPQRILNKRGLLSISEWRLLKTHPSLGAGAVDEVAPVREEADAVRAHHERWDGQGYPLGLAGEGIPWAARAIAVADTIDALTTHRPYRETISFEAATQEVLRCADSQFDPEVVEAAATLDPAEWELVREQAESTDPKFDALVAGYL